MLLIVIYINMLLSNPIPSGKGLKEMQIDTSYNYCIEVLKKYECFRPERYHLFNEYYIGYGHLIKESDTLYQLTEKQAENILKLDFRKNLKLITKKRPELPLKNRLILSMLSFNIGYGKVLKSGLIHNDSTFESQYIKFSFINDRYHKRLNQRRKDELILLTTNNQSIDIYQCKIFY